MARPIRLYVNGKRYVITSDDGYPEIRQEEASPLSRDKRTTVTVSHEGTSVPIDLRVEEVA